MESARVLSLKRMYYLPTSRIDTGAPVPEEGSTYSARPSGVPAITHTFARVALPRSTRQHPLAGLWKGLHGAHGAQLLSVGYNFKDHAARIVGTKVCVSVCVVMLMLVMVGETSQPSPLSPLQWHRQRPYYAT